MITTKKRVQQNTKHKVKKQRHMELMIINVANRTLRLGFKINQLLQARIIWSIHSLVLAFLAPSVVCFCLRLISLSNPRRDLPLSPLNNPNPGSIRGRFFRLPTAVGASILVREGREKNSIRFFSVDWPNEIQTLTGACCILFNQENKIRVGWT